MEIISLKLGFTAKTNSVGFPNKAMHMWLPVAPEEIGGRWEQLHGCFLPVTARKWCPTRRVLSHKKVPQKEAHIGNVLILRNSLLSMGSCQRLYTLWLFDTSFVCTKEGRPLWASRWKQAYACKLIFGLCHSPPQMESQCG
jgi:hypothetical protein